MLSAASMIHLLDFLLGYKDDIVLLIHIAATLVHLVDFLIGYESHSSHYRPTPLSHSNPYQNMDQRIWFSDQIYEGRCGLVYFRLRSQVKCHSQRADVPDPRIFECFYFIISYACLYVLQRASNQVYRESVCEERGGGLSPYSTCKLDQNVRKLRARYSMQMYNTFFLIKNDKNSPDSDASMSPVL